MDIDRLLAAGCTPVMAILRGIQPAQVIAIGTALVEEGVRIIEVPLNSPDPFTSIALLQEAFGDVACIGAGTVLDVASVERLAATGAKLMVAPNADPMVIAHGLSLGLTPMPGVMTPTEAFSAIRAGAKRLKLFPSSAFSPGFVRAIREVIPRDIPIWAVGGTHAGNLREWLDAGSEGIGVGSSLYKPGDTDSVVRLRARELVSAFK